MEKYDKIRDDAFKMAYDVLMEKFGDNDVFFVEAFKVMAGEGGLLLQ